ncbi:hypothetical protein [Flavobacterium poyangense]|uniref:hypothetical protein n=1 Tax=Flavobacterium poyangense TaxID=2204302 RepID=UPI0014210348|nr:hypothetical protein [Flavobacterium sp. JXAS1]
MILRKIVLGIILLGLNSAYSQTGINTETPSVTLDVRETNPSSPTSAAGIGCPQVSTLPNSGNRSGQLVYLTTDNMFYYYDGTIWKCLNCSISGATMGDVKNSFKTADHEGWLLLNGRNLTTLTATQMTAAAALGFTNTIPNATNKLLKMKGVLGSTNGNDQVVLGRANLPNIQLTGTTNYSGAHRHTYTDRGSASHSIAAGAGSNPIADDKDGSYQTESAGDHNHTVTISTGGSNSPINTENTYLSTNVFIYLGL